MMPIKNPCLECQNSGCEYYHMICKKYNDYTEERERLKKLIYMEKEKDRKKTWSKYAKPID